MSKPILEIKDLHAGVENKQILKGVSLTINAGEVHAVMGPNGSGKSTLAAVLAGRDGYDITNGEVIYNGHDLLDLDPELAILDETDSGLDIDALKIVSHCVNKLKRPDNAQLVITHYQRLLNYIVPDFVHVLVNGRIVKSGDKSLALELEAKGYDWIEHDLVGAAPARS